MKQTFPTGIVALAVTATLGLAGCSADGGPSQPSATPFDPSALTSSTTPGTTSVDEVTWGLLRGEPPTLDPARVSVTPQFISIGNMCESLLQLQPDFSAAPGIASTAEWVGNTVVFTLRDDVTFWDGTPLTAEDVAFSLSRARDPKAQSTQLSTYRNVSSIDITGEHEVTVTFSAPDSQFLSSMAGAPGIVYQKAFAEAAGEDFGTSDGGVMCTGPFAFDSWTPGQSISMTAYEDYWGGAPLVERLTLRIVPNDSTLTSALLSGEIDGAFDVPSGASELRTSDAGTLYVGPSTASMSFGPTTSEGLAADPRVREALDLAIDKLAVIDTVLNGLGTPVRTFTVPFQWEGLAAADIYRAGYDALEAPTYDLDAAKKIMAEVDITDPSLVLAVSAGVTEARQAATIVQAAGTQLGLDIEVRELQATDFSALFVNSEARQGIDFLLTTAIPATPGVLQYPSLFAIQGSAYNFSNYENADVTRLLGEARATTDPEESAEAFVNAQAIFAPARLQVSLAGQYTRVFLNNALTGVTTSLGYVNSPWALHLGGK